MKTVIFILLLSLLCSCSKQVSLQDLPKEPISITKARVCMDGGSVVIQGVDGDGNKFDLCLYNGLDLPPDVRPYFILGTALPDKKEGMIVATGSNEEKALISAFQNYLNSTTNQSNGRDAVEIILERLN